VITAYELKKLLHGAIGLPGVVVRVRSGEYQVPKIESLNLDFAPVFREWLSKLGLGYNGRRFNCIAFTDLAKALAEVFHAKTQSDTDAALAVAEFNYRKVNGDYHDILLWVVSDDGNRRPLFWEPQTQREITLDPMEVLSCDGCLF